MCALIYRVQCASLFHYLVAMADLDCDVLPQIKTQFLELLKETSDLDRSSRYSDVKRRIDGDARYKAVDSSTRREDWFKDYVRTLDKVR